MKRHLVVAFIMGWLATGNLMAGGYSSRTEPFTAPFRDRDLWKVANVGATFLQSDGHLYFTATNSQSSLWARWYWKPVITLTDSAVLDVSVLVRLPLLSMPASSYMQMGFGLKQADTYSSHVFVINQGPGGRLFYIQTNPVGAESTFAAFVIPSSSARLYLRMRYNHATSKLTCYWRAPADATWTRLGTGFNLKSRWGVVTPELKVTPLLLGISHLRPVSLLDNVYIDNVTVEYISSPEPAL